MSLMSYINAKNKPRISIDLVSYKEELEKDVFGLSSARDVIRQTLNTVRISNWLTELHYPAKDQLLIALASAKPQVVTKAYNRFIEWAIANGLQRLNKNTYVELERELSWYKARLYLRETEEIDVEKAHKIIESSVAETETVLNKMAVKIEAAINKIPAWNHNAVTLVAVYPSRGYVTERARVIVGQDPHSLEFTYRLTPLGMFEVVSENVKADDVPKSKTDDVPKSVAEDYERLVSQLRNRNGSSQILTLFFTSPKKQRHLYERTKREISLGINSVIPGNVLLRSTAPEEPEKDIWKVRIDKQYVKLAMEEGDERTYSLLEEEAPVRWLELVREAQ